MSIELSAVPTVYSFFFKWDAKLRGGHIFIFTRPEEPRLKTNTPSEYSSRPNQRLQNETDTNTIRFFEPGAVSGP